MEAKYETGKLARWALRLSAFEFEIRVKAGKANSIPDMLSRYPQEAVASYVVERG